MERLVSYGRRFHSNPHVLRQKMLDRLDRVDQENAHREATARPPIPKCPSGRSQSQEQLDADLIVERHWRTVTRLVEERDGNHCRICGKRCRFNAPLLKERADPHHVIFASAGGGDETKNICKLCRSCHDDVHVHRVLALSGDADARDEFDKPKCLRLEKLTESGWQVIGLV